MALLRDAGRSARTANRGLKPTATIVALLRDAGRSCAHCQPWVETHGYHRGVATRRGTILRTANRGLKPTATIVASLRDAGRFARTANRGLKPTATIVASLRDGQRHAVTLRSHSLRMLLAAQATCLSVTAGQRITGGLPDSIRKSTARPNVVFAIHGPPSRSDGAMVAVGFNPRTMAPQNEVRRVATIETVAKTQHRYTTTSFSTSRRMPMRSENGACAEAHGVPAGTHTFGENCAESAEIARSLTFLGRVANMEAPSG